MRLTRKILLLLALAPWIFAALPAADSGQTNLLPEHAAENGRHAKVAVQAILVVASDQGTTDPGLSAYEANLRRVLRFKAYHRVGSGSATIAVGDTGTVPLGAGQHLEVEIKNAWNDQIMAGIRWWNGKLTLANTAMMRPRKSAFSPRRPRRRRRAGDVCGHHHDELKSSVQVCGRNVQAESKSARRSGAVPSAPTCSLHADAHCGAAACTLQHGAGTANGAARAALANSWRTQSGDVGVMNTIHPLPRHGSFLLSLCSALALLAGCASEPESRVVSSPPPATPPAPTNRTVVVPPAGSSTTTTTTAAPAAAPGQTIIVQQAPPAPREESMPARPSEEHVWVPGYWAWQYNQYTWVEGHWAIPPREGLTWIPPRWEQEGNGYRFYDGYWG